MNQAIKDRIAKAIFAKTNRTGAKLRRQTKRWKVRLERRRAKQGLAPTYGKYPGWVL